jgi:hypothetical protein
MQVRFLPGALRTVTPVETALAARVEPETLELRSMPRLGGHRRAAASTVIVGWGPVILRMRLVFCLVLPALLLLLISTLVGALAEITVGLATILSPLTFIGRWHPIRQSRWCLRAFRDGHMPPKTSTPSQDAAFVKAWAQAGGPPPPLACPFDTPGPYTFASRREG